MPFTVHTPNSVVFRVKVDSKSNSQLLTVRTYKILTHLSLDLKWKIDRHYQPGNQAAIVAKNCTSCFQPLRVVAQTKPRLASKEVIAVKIKILLRDDSTREKNASERFRHYRGLFSCTAVVSQHCKRCESCRALGGTKVRIFSLSFTHALSRSHTYTSVNGRTLWRSLTKQNKPDFWSLAVAPHFTAGSLHCQCVLKRNCRGVEKKGRGHHNPLTIVFSVCVCTLYFLWRVHVYTPVHMCCHVWAQAVWPVESCTVMDGCRVAHVRI